MKFEKVPPGLKVTAQETISNLIIRALWKNQIHSEASPTSGKSTFTNLKPMLFKRKPFDNRCVDM